MGGNNGSPLSEPAWRRAYRDSEIFRASGRFFWPIEVMGAAIFAAVAFLVEPADPSKAEQAFYPLVGVVGGLAVIYGVILFWNFVRAPYRQRDEVRERFKQAQREAEEEAIQHEQALSAIQAAKPKIVFLSPDPKEHETVDLYEETLVGGNQVSRGTPALQHMGRHSVRLWRLIVRNDGAPATEVRVKFEALDPEQSSVPTNVFLHRRDDNPPDHRSYKEAFPIGHDDEAEYDFLAMTNDPPYLVFLYKTGSLGAVQQISLETGNYVARVAAYDDGEKRDFAIAVNTQEGKLEVALNS